LESTTTEIYTLSLHDALPIYEVVVLSEAMGLVADVLQQPQGRGVTTQPQGFRHAGAVDLFLALRQRDQARRLDAEHAEDVQRRVELPLAAVDEQHVGEGLLLLLQATEAAADDL